MKKITLLGFGGTIAMVANNSGALKPAKSVDELLEYVPHLSELAELSIHQLENLDSTNVNPNHWMRLAKEIDKHVADSDAIVVTHGTDTMAYTGSAIALALGPGLKIPVVITGSQLPIAEVGNDARFNLENSIKTAIKAVEDGVCEVMIVFYDKVLRAARSLKTSESKFDAFDSPAFPYLGQITATGVTFNPIAFGKETSDYKLQPTFNSNIFTVDLSPGLDPKILNTLIESESCDAMLLKSLGAGNVPTIDPYSLLPSIKLATKHNIPVLISTKFIGGRTLPDIYETGKLAIEAGAIPTGNMTDVMAQVKLMWLLAQGIKSTEELTKATLRSLVGEVDS